jgi:hypothetical protein
MYGTMEGVTRPRPASPKKTARAMQMKHRNVSVVPLSAYSTPFFDTMLSAPYGVRGEVPATGSSAVSLFLIGGVFDGLS